MKNRGITGIFILAASLFSCKPTEILLHGDIAGIVTDAANKLPVQDASIKLNTSNDSTFTGNDGSFLFKHLTPGEYEIQASSSGYAVSKQNVVLASAETKQIDFSLNGIPLPKPSVSFLDFGLDSTVIRFSISNIGKGKFTYFLTSSKDWISVTPSSGEITSETNNIVVTVNKTGLSNTAYKETIKLISIEGQTPLPEIIIPVFLNGVADKDGNYYNVIWIGSQLWMAENLNIGTQVIIVTNSSNNGVIEKYCYDNDPKNCRIYGGLYQWDEMMQYKPYDLRVPGTTQGICPDGWHIPSNGEWNILESFLDLQNQPVGGLLKETGFAHWLNPNAGATNETGFTALPGGSTIQGGDVPFPLGSQGSWWSSLDYSQGNDPNHPELAGGRSVLYNSDQLNGIAVLKTVGLSVRCVKNPAK
jgi:uncharacterized protein (TIGR02145 family)